MDQSAFDNYQETVLATIYSDELADQFRETFFTAGQDLMDSLAFNHATYFRLADVSECKYLEKEGYLETFSFAFNLTGTLFSFMTMILGFVLKRLTANNSVSNSVY